MQYYEYKWDKEKFGIDEHTWMKHVMTLVTEKFPDWFIEIKQKYK